MRPRRSPAVCLVTAVLSTACTMVPVPPPGLPGLPAPAPTSPPARGGAPARAPVQVEIPPGQMPPPGTCRLWFPGRPPGQQPPPGDCGTLQRLLPAGAILLRG